MKNLTITISYGLYVLTLFSACTIGSTVDRSDYPVTLTAAQTEHPLSKYYHNRVSPNPDKYDLLISRPAEEAVPLAQVNETLLLGDQKMEYGFTQANDGSGYVAVKTTFPNAKIEMFDWWFDWVGYDTMRYKIWYPELHAMALYEDHEEPTHPSILSYVMAHPEGKTKHTIECMMQDGDLQDLQITFVNPEQFGIDLDLLGDHQLAFCGNVETGGKRIVQMIHFVRDIQGGVELRSRFWVGLDFPSWLRKILVNEDDLHDLAHHCLSEYTQLSSFLPEVYEQYGPKTQSSKVTNK